MCSGGNFGGPLSAPERLAQIERELGIARADAHEARARVAWLEQQATQLKAQIFAEGAFNVVTNNPAPIDVAFEAVP